MEYRPDSGPEQSTLIRREGLNRVLQELNFMHMALIRWEGPRHASFVIVSAQLLSFVSTLPKEGKPSPEALRAAGFFYIANYLIISVTEDGGASVPFFLLFIYYYCLQVGRQQTGRVSIAVVVSRTG